MFLPASKISEKEKKRYVRRKMCAERRKCFVSAALYGMKQNKLFSSKRFFLVWFDMMVCGLFYSMPYKRYEDNDFYHLSRQQRKAIGESLINKNKNKFSRWSIRWNWYKEHKIDRDIQIKYTGKEWEKSAKRREKRRRVYKQRYNMGDDCLVQYDVDINRAHCLNGSITIGNRVLLAKHVFIDYSGEVTIKDDVMLTNGVIIETHHHAIHSNSELKRDIITPTSLVIEEGAVLGSRAIVLSTCHYIGKKARIGAGAVVTKDVPDYATVVGVPAKVIKTSSPITQMDSD